MWSFDEFLQAMGAPPNGAESRMDALVTTVRGVSGRDDFNDDFSMVELFLG
jgi:hypothetical protein